jgi:hypothetical protein
LRALAKQQGINPDTIEPETEKEELEKMIGTFKIFKNVHSTERSQQI